MTATQAWLGLGVFPDRPVAEYLARGLSTVYVLLGVLYLLLASDVRRYAPVITLVSIVLPLAELSTAGILLARDRAWGVALFVLAAGSTLMGALVLALQARVRRSPAAKQAGGAEGVES
jgi:hypothetical protein